MSRPLAAEVSARPLLDWSAIIGGAVVAAGVSVTLLAFGSGIGLSVVSSAPTWRDSSGWLWLLSGVFLVFVAICSFGVGGYVAGRMRDALRTELTEEYEFREGMQGLAMWGLAILLTALFTLGTAAIAVRTTTPSGGSAGAGSSVAGENIIASELDELFRSPRTPAANIEYQRAEAARILLTSSSHNGVPSEDRDYLAGLVADRSGVSDVEAADRVNRVIDESSTEIRRAREAAVMQAFLIAAALVLGAAIAWFGAARGARDRELGRIPVWEWSSSRRATRPTSRPVTGVP